MSTPADPPATMSTPADPPTTMSTPSKFNEKLNQLMEELQRDLGGQDSQQFEIKANAIKAVLRGELPAATTTVARGPNVKTASNNAPPRGSLVIKSEMTDDTEMIPLASTSGALKRERSPSPDGVVKKEKVHMNALSLVVGKRKNCKVCSEVHKLHMPDIKQYIVNEDGTPMFPQPQFTSSLRLNSVNKKTVDGIMVTCPNINKLEVITCGAQPADWDGLVHLLKRCRPKLTWLEWFDRTSGPPDNVFAIINSLPALKHLSLRVNTECPILSIISRLEEFNFEAPSNKGVQPYLESLQFANKANTSLRRVECHSNINKASIKIIDSFKDNLLGSFSSIGGPNKFVSSKLLEDLIAKFPSLTTLSIACPLKILKTVFAVLSTRSRLVHLCLMIQCDKKATPDVEILETSWQLKSVKGLDLHLNMRSHEEISRLMLYWTVPNVQVIQISLHGSCGACNIKKFKKSESKAKIKNCLRHVLTAVKQDCPKLRKLLFDYPGGACTEEELLDE